MPVMKVYLSEFILSVCKAPKVRRVFCDSKLETILSLNPKLMSRANYLTRSYEETAESRSKVPRFMSYEVP